MFLRRMYDGIGRVSEGIVLNVAPYTMSFHGVIVTIRNDVHA
jgi:hypothetical protein